MTPLIVLTFYEGFVYFDVNVLSFSDRIRNLVIGGVFFVWMCLFKMVSSQNTPSFFPIKFKIL